MPEENLNQEFRLKEIDEIRNYLTKEINRNEVISKNHKNVSRVLNYIGHSLIAISTITRCVSISAFAPLVGIPVRIRRSSIGSKICVITAGMKRYQLIIKKKRKKHNKIVLLAKSKLNNIEVVTSRDLSDSNISHDQFILINNVLKEFDDMKEKRKNFNSKQRFSIYIQTKRCCLIV